MHCEQPGMMKSVQREDARDYDVVIIGGAIAGAASALILKRWLPDARVLIVERAERFNRKVGEATVEVSAHFITKVLGLTHELAHRHLTKQGLRFWFDGGFDSHITKMSELGPSRLPGMQSFHLDRELFDEKVLSLAVEAGAELARPAQVADVEQGWPMSHVTFAPQGGEKRRVSTRWVIDASGRQTFLGRRMGLIEKVEAHPTAAAWARWRGVANLDDPKVIGTDPRMPKLPRIGASRGLGTNHFCGHGWWCWVIPLSGGETSLGVVYDKRIFDLPGEGKTRERYENFLRAQPGLRDLVKDAEIDGDDFIAYKDLPYRSKQYAGRGWALVGDAAGFMDPFYSPGLDHMSFSVYATARIVEDDLAGKLCEVGLDKALMMHNGEFTRSYTRWFESLYIDKYELFGDAELVTASYYIDIGMYYLGVVMAVFRDVENFRSPVLGVDAKRAVFAAWLMTSIKRRMVNLAKQRRMLGVVSRASRCPEHPWRQYPAKFALGFPAVKLVLRGVRAWWDAELQTLLHRVKHGNKRAAMAAETMPTAEPMPRATLVAAEPATNV